MHCVVVLPSINILRDRSGAIDHSMVAKNSRRQNSLQNLGDQMASLLINLLSATHNLLLWEGNVVKIAVS